MGQGSAWQRLGQWWRQLGRARPACFHCGEPVYTEVWLEFAGAPRLLCCHGCAAVLQAVTAAGQSDAYLAHKDAASPPPSA